MESQAQGEEKEGKNKETQNKNAQGVSGSQALTTSCCQQQYST